MCYQPSASSFRCRRLNSNRGFTLVEMGVVTLIIGVMAAAAMPALRLAAQTARANAVVNDLRVFASAFQAYAQQNGAYPVDAAIGVLPPVMVGSLGNTSWLRVTPIRGRYNWEYNKVHVGTRYRAAIGIRTKSPSTVMTDRQQLLAIDRRIDDGNLATGNFILGAGNAPLFIIER